MQQRKEHGKVTLGRHPQLDGRHRLEGTLNLADPLDEAERPEQRQKGGVRRDEVAHDNPQRSRREQRFVGKAELHAEEDGEVHRHPRQVAVQTHLEILAHERRFAHHVTQVGHVQPARELEADGQKDIKPRLQLTRHEVTEHRHRKRSVQYRCSHISISLYIPH